MLEADALNVRYGWEADACGAYRCRGEINRAFTARCYKRCMSAQQIDRWAELRQLRKQQRPVVLAPWERMAVLERAAERRAARLLDGTQAD